MEQSIPRNQLLVLAFGMPVMTTLIVIASMYAGHLITTTSERPTEVRVQASQPRIDVNIPQTLPPNIQVSAAAPRIDVHVPQVAPPAVTVNTPPAAPTPIIVNPAAVTILDRREDKPAAQLVKTSAPATSTKPESAPFATAVSEKTTTSATTASNAGSPTFSAPTPLKAVVVDMTSQEPTLDNLYANATHYIELYCRKRGLDPSTEARRWNASWRANVDQAIADSIDSSEQTYINRIVIAKRDYFNMHSASPEKVVEACRILLRYRDGQLAWLQAMKDALTNENLRKTLSFLAQGPQ